MKEIPIIQDHNFLAKDELPIGKVVIKESTLEYLNNIFKETRESFDLECCAKVETDGSCHIVSFSIKPKTAARR